jgi:hypothetical protein
VGAGKNINCLRIRRRAGALVLCFLCSLICASAAAAAPSNDDFANREALSGALPIEVTRSNVDATRENTDELGFAAAGHSVWFDWTATMTGWVTASTCDATFPTVLDIFGLGTLGEREGKVTIGNPSEGPHCFFNQEFTFPAVSGKHYAIGVDGNAFRPEGPPPQTQGSIPLRIEATPPPPNDDFAKAQALTADISEEPDGNRFYLATAPGDNWNATTESGEPAPSGHPGGASVWYDWTAPASGPARVSLALSGSQTLQIYTGASVGSLTPVPSTSPYPGELDVSVEAGKLYRIAIAGRFDGTPGETPETGFWLHASMQPPRGPGYSLDTETGPASNPPAAPRASPPNTKLHEPKIEPRRHRATFNFSSNQSGGSFRCKLDNHPYTPCSSPKTYTALSPGRHTFAVAAVNAAGEADSTPAQARFRFPRRTDRAHRGNNH